MAHISCILGCIFPSGDKRASHVSRQGHGKQEDDVPERCCSPPWHPPTHQTGDLKVVDRPRSPLGLAPPAQATIEAQQPAPRELYRAPPGMAHSVVSANTNTPKVCTFRKRLGSLRWVTREQNKKFAAARKLGATRSRTCVLCTRNDWGRREPTFLSHASPTAYTPSTLVFW